jgi:uncharacterized repeat protein (TIGR01451 family)
MRAQTGRKGSLLVAFGVVATALLVVAVGTAPAGNRNPTSSLAAVPGPAEVTSGQSVSLTASLANTRKSTFTHVRFLMSLPAGTTLVSTSCADAQVVGGSPAQFICNWGPQLGPGQTATVVVVLRTPASGPSTLSLQGTWTIKEGDRDDGNRSRDDDDSTFPTNRVDVTLLAANDPRKASGFATTVCTNPDTPTLATNPSLGQGNPLATSICAPDLPTESVTGIVAGIAERDHQSGDPGISQVSDICLPAPGFPCGGQAFHFGSPATFTFALDNTALPPVCHSHFATTSAGDQYGGGDDCKLRQITKVFHDGARVSTSSSADPRVVSIAFDRWQKTTTVVVKSSKNGRWDFG